MGLFPLILLNLKRKHCDRRIARLLFPDFPSALRFTRVKTLHSQIGGVVHTLNDKISKVLQKQEKEFLAAYRAHMYQVTSSARPFCR